MPITRPAEKSGLWLDLLVVVLLCSIAVTPLVNERAPCTHDGLLHFFRVVAMRHSLDNGLVFTRYTPELAFGYGYPFFNYREPVSYYLTLALYVLGLSLPVALNAVYIISLVGAGIGAYLLGRDLFGRLPGLVAAVAYVYAPYQFLDALVRGNAPESVALALMPFVLWAFRRLAFTGRRQWVALSVVSLGLLYLTHNISSLLFTPFLLAFIGVLCADRRARRHWAVTGAALALSLGMTAFFWVPALLERGAVHLDRSISSANNDYRNNFLTLAEAFALPETRDLSLMNPALRVYLGLAQMIVGAIGLVLSLVRETARPRRLMAVFLGVATVAMVWMSTASSQWLWDRLPLIAFVQFPWRLIGRAVLPVALLAGASVDLSLLRFGSRTRERRPRLGNRWALRIWGCLVTGALILTAMPDMVPIYGFCETPPDTLAGVFEYERSTGLVGIDPEGSYFPVGVERVPDASPLEDALVSGAVVYRFDREALPEGATIHEELYGPNQARIVVETPAAFRARYLVFGFPGWNVRIDGRRVATAPTEPDGLLSFDVPSGHRTITVSFESTPVRIVSGLLSSASLAVLLFLLMRRQPVPESALVSGEHTPDDRIAVYGALVMLAVAMLALKLTVIDRKDTVFRRSGLETGHLVGVEVPLSVSFSDQVLLLGLSPGDGESLESRSGVIDLTTYWRVQQPVNQDYALVFTLIDGLGRPYAEASSGQQTSLWSPDQYARQQQSLLLWPGTPPGEYSLRVAVVDPSTGAVLDTTRPDGEPLGRSYELSLVTVSDSTPSLRPDGWEPARLLAADLGVGMALLGIDAPSGEVDAGGTLNLTLYWQAAGTMAEDWQVELRLLEADGTALAQEVFAPGQASYPTSAWRPGDVVRDARAFRVPARTPSGCYALCVATVGVSDAAGAACHPVLHVTVRAPCRDYRVPSMQHPLDRVIGNAVALLGYDIDSQPSAPGEPVELKLFWRAEAEMARSYTVFVHVVDANGRTVAQSDVVPGDGVRPTTGWLPGEIVPSIHLLEPPAGCTDGCYALRIGMYDRVTGERLPVSGHADLDSVLLSDALCCQ